MVNFNEQVWSISNGAVTTLNAMEENNIQSVGGPPTDLIQATNWHDAGRTPADPRLRFTVAALLLNLRECPETAGYRL